MRMVGVCSGKGLCSWGTGEATDLGDGRWRGCKQLERQIWGLYKPQASKASVGVYEGDANSHFQERVILMKISSVPRTGGEEDEGEVPGAHRPPNTVCLSSPRRWLHTHPA